MHFLEIAMASVVLIGGTGVVGSHILSTLLFIPSITLAIPSITKITAIARRPLKFLESTKLQPIIEADTSQWPQRITEINPKPAIFISALGTSMPHARMTTKMASQQRKADLALNIELARAAKRAGVKVYVLISGATPEASACRVYQRMKGKLKDVIKELDFEHTVVLMPGLIVGLRDEARSGQVVVSGIAKVLGSVSGRYLKDPWAQDADVIARAAVVAGLKCLEGSAKDRRIWEISHTEVIRLGRTEWRERCSYWPEKEVCPYDSDSDDPFHLEQTLEQLKQVEVTESTSLDMGEPIRIGRYGLPCIMEGQTLNTYC